MSVPIKNINLLLALLIASIFFSIALITIDDYNISWDETIHFRRGQAYLHYFLTGSRNYQDLKFNERRSFYQNDYHNGEYFLKDDVGHPPVNDITAAFYNYVLFQKLGWIGDIQSHHIFNISASALLVFIVFYWLASTFGKFAGIVGALSLTLYPLFFAESHFNIKDPPEAAFFVLTLWAFWYSLKKVNVLWLIMAWVFFGLALGIKFNILFLPLIIIFYIVFYYYKQQANIKKIKSSKLYLLLLIFGPLISIGILILLWPYITQDVINNLPKIFGYYSQIGSGMHYQPDNYYFLNFNLYPVLWILVTTPPVILFLSGTGIIGAYINRKCFDGVAILWLGLLLIPIMRVSLPNASIYGGIRQIMEYLPAMALLTGLGAWLVIEWCRKKNKRYFYPAIFLVLSSFIWPLLVIIKMHPHENVYFNQFIGGLPGAKERNFPSWGNSFGNAYLQCIKWLNINTEKNAKVALIQGTASNLPAILLRSDLNLQNSNFSGSDRKGEYLVELTFNDTARDYNYAWEYVEKFLEPVYEVKVDGVAIAKIWKNDLAHTKKSERKTIVNKDLIIDSKIAGNSLIINLDEEIELSQIKIDFSGLKNCNPENINEIALSSGNNTWIKEKDLISSSQIYRKNIVSGGQLVYNFAGKRAKSIRLTFDNGKVCLIDINNVDIFIFK